MKIHVSRRLAELPAYAFAEMDRKVRELTADGVDVIDLGVGDPVRPAPAVVTEACRLGLEEFATAGYPPYDGIEEFRTAAADWMMRTLGLEVDPAREIHATIGSKEAVFHFPAALVDPGDGVLAPSPGYVPYYRGTTFAGGVCIPYPLVPGNRFLPDPEDIASRIDAARSDGCTVRLLWLCHPNAPTGSVADEALYSELIEVARKRDVVVASDEAYIDFVWKGPTTSALNAGREGVIAFYSLSKRSNMTGYRAGWVAGDPELVSLLHRVKVNLDSGTPCFVQKAAAAALSDLNHVEAMRAEYRENFEVLTHALNDAGLPCTVPDGSIYLWLGGPDGMSSGQLCEALLAPDVAIAALPGEALSPPVDGEGSPGAGRVRFSMTALPDRVREAARRIRESFEVPC